MSPLSPVKELLGRLEQVHASSGPEEAWTARCPAHDDQHPSLSVAVGEDGRVLVNCHAGCDPDSIVAALGLRLSDLFVGGGGSHDRTRARSRTAWFPTAEEAECVLLDSVRRKHGPGYQLASVSEYLTERGGALHVLRFEHQSEQKQVRQMSSWADGWVLKRPREKTLPYRSTKLPPEGVAWVVEGEKCADTLQDLGIAATTSAGGSAAFNRTDWSTLAGREVVVCPDNDEPGGSYGRGVAKLLQALDPPCTVRWLELEDLTEGGDVVDFVERHRLEGSTDSQVRETLLGLAGAAREISATQGDLPESRERNGQPLRLVELALRLGMEFFHAPGCHGADCYAVVPRNGHRETWPLGSSAFKFLLCREFYFCEGESVSDGSFSAALTQLIGMALFGDKEAEVAVRVAGHAGKVYVDLGRDDWSAIEIDADGYRVVDPVACGVHFVRRDGQRALPLPEPGGCLDELRELVNVPDDEDWTILKGFLLMSLHPTGPYPVLVLNGQAGSAKTTLCRLVRDLVDPQDGDVRRPPSKEEDLAVMARGSWIVAIDNLSGLQPKLSDAVCCLSTGATLSKRKLYSNDEEIRIRLKRPVILSGIENVATRGDLADRSIVITLPPIPRGGRRLEREIRNRFRDMHARLLGAVLAAAVVAIRDHEAVVIDELERMADFCVWGTAGESGLEIVSGGFMQAYQNKVRESAREAMEASPVAAAVVEFMDSRDQSWVGTAGDLWRTLESHAAQADWPNNPVAMAHALRRAAPSLKSAEIEVLEPSKNARPRNYTIRRLTPQE